MLELGKTRQVMKKRRRRVTTRRRRTRATCPWSWRCWCRAGLAVLRSRSADFWPTCQGKNPKMFIPAHTHLYIQFFSFLPSHASKQKQKHAQKKPQAWANALKYRKPHRLCKQKKTKVGKMCLNICHRNQTNSILIVCIIDPLNWCVWGILMGDWPFRQIHLVIDIN